LPNDLSTTLKISLEEALLGFHKVIRHLDNHKVEIIHDGVTQPGSTELFKGEGMP